MTKAIAIEARKELRRRVLAELRARGPEAYRAAVKALILASLHEKQRGVIEAIRAGLRYLSLCCSRRSGKTNLLAKLIVLTLLDAGHNQAVFYVAPTLKIGKGLIWGEVEKLIKDYELDEVLKVREGWKLREHSGEIVTDTGAHFLIVGLNKEKQGNVSRGFDALLFLTDETQEYEYLLRPTLTAVGPALSGRRGVFIAAGTPGYTPQGTWFDWCHDKDGFKNFHWTVLDNPKNPRPGVDVIAEEKARRGLEDDHPEIQREWYGRWVADFDVMVAEFNDTKNSLAELPENYGPHWKHVIGIDYGFDDACAWVVIAANPYGPERIVVHAEAHAKLIHDEAVSVTRRLVDTFGTSHVVCDYAGGGKPFYETFNAKYGKELGCYIRAARKGDKPGRVRFLNTELRTGRLQLMRACDELEYAEGLVRELKRLRWKDPEKTEIVTTREIRDDLFDAALYALMEIAPWQPREAPSAERAAADAQAAQHAARMRADAEYREREERNRAARQSAAQPWYAKDRASVGQARFR